VVVERPAWAGERPTSVAERPTSVAERMLGAFRLLAILLGLGFGDGAQAH
jgi:hypothetical protein